MNKRAARKVVSMILSLITLGLMVMFPLWYLALEEAKIYSNPTLHSLIPVSFVSGLTLLCMQLFLMVTLGDK